MSMSICAYSRARLSVPKNYGKESQEYHTDVSDMMIVLENSTFDAAKNVHGIQ